MRGMLLCLLAIAGCDGNKIYEKEMYRPVLYMLSNGANNVYTVVIPFGDTGVTTSFSIGCGGSLSNPEEAVIELEPDTVLYDMYNRINFDDSASYARLLPQYRYEIPSMTVSMPAASHDQYVEVPVYISQNGLSPDSVYFIPLAIKSVSRYEVNPDSRNILFRVAVENTYAEQINTTIYYQRGTMTSGGQLLPVNGSTVLQPLSKNEVRMFAGTRIQTAQSTLDEINTYSIVAKINADSSVVVVPYGTIDVEQLDGENYNRYYTRINAEGRKVDYFDLHYRFRTLKSTEPGVYGEWTEIRESLQRISLHD